MLERPTPPRELTDGVLVRGGASLRTLEASWVVLVTLETPRYPEQLVHLIQLVRDSRQDIKVSGYIQRSWEWRLKRLQPLDGSYAGQSRSDPPTPVGRHRRGAFDFIGFSGEAR